MIMLRKIVNKDIPYMLEWMHSNETKEVFQRDFCDISEKEAKEFVDFSFTENNQHFAIVDNSNDEYLGTISLKNIDYINKNAEYAIATREISRGKGINYKATKLLLRYAFKELKLHRIYLNVVDSNEKAIYLYEHAGFVYEGKFRDHIIINGQYVNLLWYSKIVKD